MEAAVERNFSNLICDKYNKVRLTFQAEAGFGRINQPKYSRCEKGTRPYVSCHHIREYRYVFGAVEPLTGGTCFVVMPYRNTESMNVFLEELFNTFPRNKIILVCDGAT